MGSQGKGFLRKLYEHSGMKEIFAMDSETEKKVRVTLSNERPQKFDLSTATS